MLSEPKIETRSEQPYLAILAKIPMSQMGQVLPPLWTEVFGWLASHAVKQHGAPFWRYRVINMSGLMQIEAGVPTEAVAAGNERITPGFFTAGQYATALYTGPYDGLRSATKEFLEWGENNGVKWQAWDTEEGHTWAARSEFYLSEADDEQSPENYQTELAYLTES